MKNNKFICVKDEEGYLRPMAGIWNNDEYNKQSAKDFLKKNRWCEIVMVEIKETFEEIK